MSDEHASRSEAKAKSNPLGAIGRKPGSYVGDLDSLLSEVSDTPTRQPTVSEKGVGEGSVKPKSKPAVKRINLDVPTELHQRFKGMTGMSGRTMTEVLQELIRDYLDRSSM